MSFLSSSSGLSNSFCCSAELLKAIVQTSPQSVRREAFFQRTSHRVSPDLMGGLGSRWDLVLVPQEGRLIKDSCREILNMRIVIICYYVCVPFLLTSIIENMRNSSVCLNPLGSEHPVAHLRNTLHENSWIELCMTFVKIHFN